MRDTEATKDRLAEITQAFDIEGIQGLWGIDVAWLITEVERLRATLTEYENIAYENERLRSFATGGIISKENAPVVGGEPVLRRAAVVETPTESDQP